MGVCVQKIFVAGVASFPRAWQEGETVRPSETGPLRNDRGGTGKKRLQLRRLELSNDCGHDIFKIRRKFQPALFMRVAGEDRAFVSEGEICQRRGFLCHVGFAVQNMGSAGKTAGAPIILIEDGAPYHRSAQVKEFQKNMEGEGLLFTYRLSSFSPDFNPIEKLWRNTKRNATHLRYFKTFDDLRESVLAAFRKYMNNAAEVIRVMKKLRSSAELQLLVDSFSEK